MTSAEGGEGLFRSAVGVNLEAQFTPLYAGQLLFPDIHARMLRLGFRLLHLTGRDGIYDGEVVEAECGYVRPLPAAPTRADLVNRLLFCCMYDNLSYCQLLLRQAGAAVLGRAAAGRLARAGGVSLAPAATPEKVGFPGAQA